MTTILGAAASGLVHNQNVLDVVGHNLANVNSTAFKKIRPLAEGAPDATASPDGGRLGVADTTRDPIFTVGAPQTTDNPLHFAITDDTFFRVRDFDGSTVYTRFGALDVDSAGNVVAFRGRLLEPPVAIPAGMTQPAINSAGVVSALDETGTRQDIGQVTLVRFMNPQGLEGLGDGLYRETENSGTTQEGAPASDGFGPLTTGAVEAANVDVAEEFTNMIIAQRAYQASAKTFSVGDEMLLIATNLTQ
jgi:flagellar basal body rod protein FlgG